jgi:hypothetical protein
MRKKIVLEPKETIYYIIDTDFFVNKYLNPSEGSNTHDRDRIRNSHKWWEIIDWQINKKFAILYINDLCIAETFKVIAKKYYIEKFLKRNRYQNIRNKITSDIQLSISKLISKCRFIKYHNLSIERDIIVGASRYLEIAHKHNLQTISVVDLITLSSAKYLMDFYRINKEQIYILTGDDKIIKCSKFSKDGSIVIDPLNPKNTYDKYYIN